MSGLSRRSLFGKLLGAFVVAAAASLPIRFGEEDPEVKPLSYSEFNDLMWAIHDHNHDGQFWLAS